MTPRPSAAGSYDNWAVGLPDNGNTSGSAVVEGCALAQRASLQLGVGSWDDANCSSAYMFICRQLREWARPCLAPPGPPPALR